MTPFIVFPLGDPIAAYTCHVSPAPAGWFVNTAESEEAAALAVHYVLVDRDAWPPSKRYAVQGAAGVVLIDLSPVAGRTSLHLDDEGPHR